MPRKNELPFSLEPLDPRFVGAKPLHSVSESVVLHLEQQKRTIYTRKRDGYRMYDIKGKKQVWLYTRGIEDITDRFPHIAEELLYFPENTFLDTEIVMPTKGEDDFGRLTMAMKLKPPFTQNFYSLSSHAHCIVFGINIFRGKDVTHESHGQRFEIIHNMFSRLSFFPKYITPVQIDDHSFIRSKEIAISLGWEGLVIYDATKPTKYRLDGNRAQPPRPVGCWKWKPLFEDDFIVRTWKHGTGRNKQRMGKLYLSQIHPDTGQKVSCGEVGIGFSDQRREEFARADYPLVVQVKFNKRFASGALRNPRFMRIRIDKNPEDCLFPLDG